VRAGGFERLDVMQCDDRQRSVEVPMHVEQCRPLDVAFVLCGRVDRRDLIAGGV